MKRTLPINQDNLSLINFVFLRNPKQDRMYSGVTYDPLHETWSVTQLTQNALSTHM